MTFNVENYLKNRAIDAQRFNLEKTLHINWCELDSNITDGPQVFYQNFENSPRLPHRFLYRTAGLF